MTFKEELEILRGEPIQVFDGDPMDVPCIETSDAEKICKHPVVSVHMITYNHEPYIRQAIEGVMMQKTDFEFELVIGEDCSQDKTREICFEYQKKYPDKIRVLWWHENLRKVNHPAGANGRRTMAHCRGEFIAYCEGDDYWTDPFKLQKQVDVMRRYPDVGLCFCGSKIYRGKTGMWELWDKGGVGFQPGRISARKFMLWTICGRNPLNWWGPEFFIMTATILFRVSMYRQAKLNLEIFKWRMLVGDSVLVLGMSSVGDAYYLKDVVSVYRQMPSGLTLTAKSTLARETYVVRYYYFRKFFSSKLYILPRWIKTVFCLSMLSELQEKSGAEQKSYYRTLANGAKELNVFKSLEFLLCRIFLFLGLYRGLYARIAQAFRVRYCRYVPYHIPRQLRMFYSECD